MSLKKAKKQPTDLERISNAMSEAIMQVIKSNKIEKKGGAINFATMEIGGTEFDVLINFIPKSEQ